MNFFETLDREAQARQLPFLVIGGHAVNAYGYARETADVDLLVRKEQRPTWVSCLEALAYRVSHDGGTFIQFAAPEGSAWPVDLMLVNEATFSQMLAAARELDAGPGRIRVPCVEHLIALKLHALKQRRGHRYLKDFQDVVGLVECNQLDPGSDRVKTLFEKYGTAEIYGQIVRALDAG